MWSIIRHKLKMLIILMVVLELNTGTETDNDWFSQYGEERDAGEDVLETGMEEGEVGEGTLKQKEACQNCMIIIYLLFVFLVIVITLSQLVMTTIGTRVSTATEMSTETASTRAAMMSTLARGLSTMTGPRVSLSGYAQENLIIY